MYIFTAIIIYISIAISLIQNWLLVTVFAVIFFSFRYGAVSLIPLAIVVDGYFGNFYGAPYLSLMAVIWYIVVGLVQPKLTTVKV